MICEKCGKEFPNTIIIDGIRHSLKSRKHCLECVPFGTKAGGRKKIEVNDVPKCLYCGKPVKDHARYFCSSECSSKYRHEEYIRKWKDGYVDGTIGKEWVDISNHIKRYLFEKYNYKCSRCGWSEVNPFTLTIPLEIEHIDGNAKNNREDNLILLCPNCHSLTKTYRGANRGNGNRNIKWTSRS